MSEICLWKETYRIGNKEIDEQHYLLFSKIEHLLAIAKSGDLESKKKAVSYTHLTLPTTDQV